MSPDTTRKPSRSDEDQSLLDADLLAIFGETPEAEAPASEPASEMPEPPSPEAEEPSPSIPEDGPEPEAQTADNAQASAAAEPDSMPEESAASAYDDAAEQTPPRSEAPEEPIYDNAPIYEAYQAEEAYAAAPPQASSHAARQCRWGTLRLFNQKPQVCPLRGADGGKNSPPARRV